MATEAPAPLAGVRVLDLTNVLAGPYCAYQLGLLGAEVIKVERPRTGDLARQLGADPARNAAGMGVSFLAQNAGKQSVTLDLKDPRGADLLKRLVRSADVLVENYRPGVMDRLGVGATTLRRENPHLIYCAITGFGQTGPWRDNPAYDQIVQGVAGVMAITGDTDSAPLRVGYPLADTVGGLAAAFAIAAALNAEPRGCTIDLAMTEAVLSTMGWVVSNHLIAGVPPAAHGNENTTSAPSGTFACADGPINIAANREEQWQTLARHLKRPDWLERPEFATREDRKAHRAALTAALEAELGRRPAAAWAAELNALGVPAGPVLRPDEALASPQVAGRGLIVQVDAANGERLPLAGSPAMLDGARPAPKTAPPALGADNTAIWTALGVAEDELAALRDAGVI